ncbi:hypothetical protein [Demequina mangrovi]|uniref:Uncharacterized protein n=1 Tax=Demequina mangrovi TaxID=1043493 RepID=A0A1H6ZA83_9MICO|nr:hypothetical protein [Demequina mangrovi]SEJ50493.1 hypothetical protein SAMN05421637_2051 [Demequina mangrovi]
MARDLHDELGGVLDDESREGTQRQTVDTDLYLRAVVASRSASRARRLAAVACAVAAIAVAVAILTRPGDPVPAAPEPSPSAAAATGPLAVPDARPGEAGWTVAGLTIDPRASARPSSMLVGAPFADSQFCLALDAFGRLLGGLDGTRAWHPGGFVTEAGATLDLHVRTFADARTVQEYLDEARAIARRCAVDLDGTRMEATVAAEPGGAEGEAWLVFEVRVGELPAEVWRLRLQVDGATVVAAIVEPGAKDASRRIVEEWIAAGPR